MGIRLFVEVLDYAPTTLTHREKLVLSVLAEDAPDKTRVPWNSVESPTMLRRGKVTRPQMYEVLKALVAKGALKKLSAGQRHAVAKYMILPLAPVQCPENPDTEAPSQCPDSADTDDAQCQENPDTENSQCPGIPVLSVRESRTPTPQPPTTKRLLPPRPDVAQVCNHLADRIESNGSKRPNITEAWHTAARLLIDQDGRTPEQVLRAIDWCQNDPFWRANVLSMPKLRLKYDQLRLKAAADRDRAQAEAARTTRYTDPAERGIF